MVWSNEGKFLPGMRVGAVSMQSTRSMSLKGRSLAGFGLFALVVSCGYLAAQDTPAPDNPPNPQENPPQYSTSTEQPRYTLKGTVVNAVTGEAIRGALVSLESSGPNASIESVTAERGQIKLQGRVDTNPGSAQLTDLRGQFEFSDLLGMQTSVNARKPGYFSEYGPPRNQRLAPPVWVGPDAPPVVVRLVPESVIYGKITGDDNQPVEGMSVHLIQEGVENGRRTWVGSTETQTNEDGEFRFAELGEGTYYIEAGPWWRNSLLVKEPQRRGINRAFFPDAHDFHAAAPISLSAGQKFRADLQLSREPFYKVSGVVTGQVGGGLDQQLECVDAAGEVLQFPVTVNPKDGKFDVQLPAGSWVIRLRQASDADNPELRGQVTLKVSGDMKDLSLKLAPELGMVPVVARMESTHGEGQEPQAQGGDGANGKIPLRLAQSGAFMVGLTSEDRLPWSETYTPQPIELASGETAAFAAMKPGKYRLRVANPGGEVSGTFVSTGSPAGWYVKSAQSGAADLLRDGLTVSEDATPQAIEVVYRDDGATLTGVVTTQGRPAAGAVLLVAEGIPLYNRVVMAGAEGQFIVTGLAPGNYSVLALEDGENLAWSEPEVWGDYAALATPVKLEPDQTMNIKLELVGSGRQVSNAQ
jgi:hypothetical protein